MSPIPFTVLWNAIVKFNHLSHEFIEKIKAAAVRHAAETGYSGAMLQWGFDRMFAHWTDAELIPFLCTEVPGMTEERAHALLDSECSVEDRTALTRCRVLEHILLVTASTVPSAAFQDAVLLLLLPCRVTVRPAGNLAPMFADMFRTVSEYMPLCGSRLALTPSTHDDTVLTDALKNADAVCVSGSDPVIAHYGKLVDALHGSRPHVLIPHGHRVSSMILKHGESAALSSEEIRRMAVDISVWDQTGCLSPKCLFIEESSDVTVNFAEKLVSALNDVGHELPERTPGIPDLARKNSAIRTAWLDGARVFKGNANHDILAVYEDNSSFSPVLLPRFLNIYPVPDAVAAAGRLSPAGQAFGSRLELNPEEKRRIMAAGYNYFCRFGSMQDPPLSWFHDGIGTLRPFIRS